MSHLTDSNKTNRQNRNRKSIPGFGFVAKKADGFWRKSLLNRILAGTLAVIMLFVAGMYGVAQWYIFKHRNEPLQMGVTFIPDYALQLGLIPEDTMDAIIDDLGVKHFRLVSYWKNGEAVEGQYDFSFLDWQFEKAQAADAKVSLAIGLRQPRWPECHMPKWAEHLPKSEWQAKLKDYMKAVIERYGDHPALESYQLENEFFMTVFGICPDHSRERLVDEYHFVKSLDKDTPVVISRSNNWVGLPVNEPTPDKFAISVYKRVWDQTITKRYFEYPLPAWFYASLAGGAEIVTGKDMMIHELQAEAWLPNGFTMLTAPKEELYKSLNPDRLRGRFSYGKATGMKQMDLWGVEWWYYMKERRDSPELWDVAREEFSRND